VNNVINFLQNISIEAKLEAATQHEISRLAAENLVRNWNFISSIFVCSDYVHYYNFVIVFNMLICYISSNLGTNNLNNADVPLSNEQAYEH